MFLFIVHKPYVDICAFPSFNEFNFIAIALTRFKQTIPLCTLLYFRTREYLKGVILCKNSPQLVNNVIQPSVILATLRLGSISFELANKCVRMLDLIKKKKKAKTIV